MALVRQAGWNQTAFDWMRFLRAQPDGCFAATAGDQLVGTVTTIVYDRHPAVAEADAHLAWIGMLIVDAESSRAGSGQRLLVRAPEFLDSLGDLVRQTRRHA